MVNYQNASIYKIVSNNTDLVYYGSTCKSLSGRLGQHRSDYIRYLNGAYHNVTSFELIKQNHYDIILVEYYPCNSTAELHARERFYIENNECVNKCIPSHTKKEYDIKYRNENKDKINEYITLNKDKIQERQKEYRELNKDKIKEHRKEYNEIHKDEILQKRAEYIACVLSAKYKCGCGSNSTIGNKSRHIKTIKHQNYIKSQELQTIVV